MPNQSDKTESLIQCGQRVLEDLKARGLVSDRLSIPDSEPATLHVDGRAGLEIPVAGSSGTQGWRTPLNNSLFPQAISAENRHQILYALLQAQIKPEMRLRLNAGEGVKPLGDWESDFAPFDGVYTMQIGRNDREVLFPVHIAVPACFDLYPTNQTAKGFRGTILSFFGSNPDGQRDALLHRILRTLSTPSGSEASALDRALVLGLTKRLLENSKVQEHLDKASVAPDNLTEVDNAEAWRKAVFSELPATFGFRPVAKLSEHGRRMRRDIQGIAHCMGLTWIERLSLIERLLCMHLALYLARLPSIVSSELNWIEDVLGMNSGRSGFVEEEAQIRFHARRPTVPMSFNAQYKTVMDQVKDAYLLLPVLNNVELAIRALDDEADGPARIQSLQWQETRQNCAGFLKDAASKELAKEVLRFLAEMARNHVDPYGEIDANGLDECPIHLLYTRSRQFYSQGNNPRYPNDKLQLQFERMLGKGPSSCIQTRNKVGPHFILGDEFLYLLVLTEFSRLKENDLSSDCVPKPHQRTQIPLRDFMERLEENMLVPADARAQDDLHRSLSRLGLLERLSDVGRANFLRHPMGA